MTRPAEVKVREDSTPGTRFDAFTLGERLPLVRFTITPAIVEEYIVAIEADRALYRIDGRRVAPPNILAAYMTSTVYRRYPPIQGIIMISAGFEFHRPIWADEETTIDLDGTITALFEKNGRKYVQWRGEYRRHLGRAAIASVVNCFSVPE
jgi:hypothetical protein